MPLIDDDTLRQINISTIPRLKEIMYIEFGIYRKLEKSL